MKSLRKAAKDIADLEPAFEKQKLIADSILESGNINAVDNANQLLQVWNTVKKETGSEIADFYKFVDDDLTVSINPSEMAEKIRSTLLEQAQKSDVNVAAVNKLKLALKKLENIPSEKIPLGRATMTDTWDFVKNVGKNIPWDSPDQKATYAYIKDVRKQVQDEMMDLIEKQEGQNLAKHIKGLNKKYTALSPITKIIDKIEQGAMKGDTLSKSKLRQVIGESLYSVEFKMKHPTGSLLFEGLGAVERVLKSDKSRIKGAAKAYRKYIDAINWEKVQEGKAFKDIAKDLSEDVLNSSGTASKASFEAMRDVHHHLYKNDKVYKNIIDMFDNKEQMKEEDGNKPAYSSIVNEDYSDFGFAGR
jgi:hypothetical protein